VPVPYESFDAAFDPREVLGNAGSQLFADPRSTARGEVLIAFLATR